MTREADVLKYVENYFKLDKNVKIWRQNAGVAFRGDHPVRLAEEGASDLIGIVGKVQCSECGKVLAEGVLLAIECKGPRGRLRDSQVLWLREIQRLGGIVVLARPLPTKDDPTGFGALKATLDCVGKEQCLECRKKQRREEESR